MIMHRRAQRITAAHRERFEALRALGCVACGAGVRCNDLEIHHLLSGNKRRGNDHTVCLCAWHHRGEPLDGYSATAMAAMFGPSLARSSRAFRERYGDDDSLLEAVNARLAQLRKLRVA